MANRAKFRRRELEGTPLGDGRHSGNQESIGRERLGLRRLYGNPNSKVAKREERERKAQGGSEAKEI